MSESITLWLICQ